MLVIDDKLIEMDKLIDPYFRFDTETEKFVLVDDAPEEIKELYPKYLKLLKKYSGNTLS